MSLHFDKHRKRADLETSPQDSETRYRTLVESAHEWVWEVNSDLVYTYAGPQCRGILGYEPQEIIGKTPFDLMPPEEARRVALAFGEIAAQRKEFRRLENINVHKDGHLVVLETNGIPIFDHQSNFCGYRGMDRDITERKRAEAEMVDRLRFETLLADLSSRFVNVSTEKLDAEIEDAQRRVCECLGLETSTLWELSSTNPDLITLTHVYGPLGGPVTPEQLNSQEYFPWRFQEVRSGKVVAVSSLQELPPEAARDRESWRQFGVKSNLTIGLTVGGGPIVGALSFNTMQAEHIWPEQIVQRLQLVAQILSNALARRRSDRVLRESEERFRSLVENATVGIYRTTPDGHILMANPTLIRMLGYAELEELAARNLQAERFEPGYGREEFLDRIEKEGEVIGLEAAWKRRDRSVIWVRQSAQAIRGQDGETLFYDGIVEDITKHKGQDQSLAESEEKFARAFKCSPQPFTLSTLREGGYLEINDAFVKKFGWSREETIGRTTFELRIWETAAEREKVVARLLGGEPISNIECRLRKKNGEMFNALLSAELIEIRGVQCVVMNAIDITDWKRAQEALSASEKRAAAYFQQTMFAAIEWDRDFRVVEWNPAAESIFGYRREEALGRHARELIVPGDLTVEVSGLFRALVNHTGGELSVNENLTKTGERIVCEWFNTPMVGQDGSITGVISLAHDITARKAAENALRELSGRLISAQEEERKRVARELHDDIGQQLALISVRLSQAAQTHMSSELSRNLAEVRQKLQHVASTIGELSHSLHPSKLQYLGIAAALRALCRDVSGAHNIQIEYRGQDNSPRLSDEAQLCLYRIAQEALRNVVKHSKAAHALIQFTSSSEGACLKVQDEGVGFDIGRPAEGLGLVSMRERLRLIGGSIEINSQPNRGTSIKVHVPPED